MPKQPKRKSYKSALWPDASHGGAVAALVDLGETLHVLREAIKRAGLSEVGIDVRSRPDTTYPPVWTFDRYLRIALEALAAIDDAVWVTERLDSSIADAELLASSYAFTGNLRASDALGLVASALDCISRNKAIAGRSELALARRTVRDAERAERRQRPAPEAEDGEEGA